MQKLSALAVAFALAFGMVGCGEKPKDTKAGEAVKKAGEEVKKAGEEVKKAGEEVKKAAETK